MAAVSDRYLIHLHSLCSVLCIADLHWFTHNSVGVKKVPVGLIFYKWRIKIRAVFAECKIHATGVQSGASTLQHFSLG